MAETTMAVTFGDLKAYTGDYLGWGKGNTTPYTDTAWSTRKSQDLDFWCKTGYAMFLTPPILPNEATAYNWSFLEPETTLAVTSGTATVTLPDDFIMLVGPLGISDSQNGRLEQVRLVGIRDVYRGFELTPDMTGYPRIAAVEPVKGTGASAGQRFQLHLFPTPDADYTLNVRYKVAPDMLTTSLPYIYGGAEHYQTILAACRAAVEINKDGIMGGPQYQQFMSRLATSISMDRNMKPEFLGTNRDRSDEPTYSRANRHGDTTILVNGVTPT